MNTQLTFHEKTMSISLSEQAVKQSNRLDNILLFEIQIYFSCLLGKRLAFYSNTVMIKACPVSEYIGPPSVTDFIISNQKPYATSWLNIEFNKGEWPDEYGWPTSNAGQTNTKQISGVIQYEYLSK